MWTAIKRCKIISLFVLLLGLTAAADTGLQLIDRVRERAIWIDVQRFPDDVLVDFINVRQITLATLGRTKEKSFMYDLAIGVRADELPADFFLIEAVERNPDPGQTVGGTNVHKIIDYVPRRELGRVYDADLERPAAYSIWSDSLYLNRASDTGFDTLVLFYLAYPTTLADENATIDLPVKFLPLLEDYIIRMCYDRVNVSLPDTLNNSILFLENQLFGRPRDLKKETNRTN